MTIVNTIVNEFIVFYDVFIEFTISLFTFPFSSDWFQTPLPESILYPVIGLGPKRHLQYK